MGDRFAAIVFVSEWQKAGYLETYGSFFRGYKGVVRVMRNAIVPFKYPDIAHKLQAPKKDGKKDDDGPLRLIYHTTPHRGLELLLPAFNMLYKKYGDRIHLDVYSSFAIYNWPHRDEPYRVMFDSCKNHPGCTYHGAVSNDEVRKALAKSHIFAYPSIWQETSCIAAIEAMSAGTTVVTSSLGALPETASGGNPNANFMNMYPHAKDPQEHMHSFLRAMDVTISTYWDEKSVARRKVTTLFAARTYDWGTAGWSFEGRTEEWIRLLSMLMPNEFNSPSSLVDKFGGGEGGGEGGRSRYAEALFVVGKRCEMRGDFRGAQAAYAMGAAADPTSSLLALALGSAEFNSQEEDGEIVGRALERIQGVINGGDDYVPAVSWDTAAGHGIASRAAIWYHQRHLPDEARLAAEEARGSGYPHDDCVSELFYATYVPQIPMTREEAATTIENYNERIDELLTRAESLICSNSMLMPNPFPVAYYDLDFREELSRWHELYMRVFRDSLALTAPGLLRDEGGASYVRPVESVSPERPLRIGFVSCFFRTGTSIWGSFGKTINHLQREPNFAVEMIYYPRSPIREQDRALSLSPSTNLYLQPFAAAGGDQNRHLARQAIVERKYDVLVYLDLFMTAELHEIAVAKLAPVQAYTHGHPVTSGMPRRVMDYFISWAAAELPDRERAQSFYTEELVLLPGDRVWEYFEPRTEGGRSLTDGQGGGQFDHYTRDRLASELLFPDPRGARLMRDPSSVLYFCAQAPFKFDFVFDEMIADIQRKDPNAVIILVRMMGELSVLHDRIEQRLSDGAHVDMDRVIFIPRMHHYHLMAMYNLCDVVLDSAYFGGDTTSREAFETGAPVVTLPHKTIGQRWTQAYYSMMGISDYVAADPAEYVDIAVKTGNLSPEAKGDARRRIMTAANEKLFRKEEGVQDWVNTFMDIASRPRQWRWADEEYVRPVT